MQPLAQLAPTTVLAKTVQARKALRDGGFTGSRPQRLFLIIVDGRKTLRELAAPLRSLGLDEPALRRMLAEGWLGMNPPPASAPGAADVPAGTSGPRAETARPRPSLGAVKMYALDLVALMLPGRDAALREAARQVQDERRLRDWVERAAGVIAQQAGPARADVFRERVRERMPASGLQPVSSA